MLFIVVLLCYPLSKSTDLHTLLLLTYKEADGIIESPKCGPLGPLPSNQLSNIINTHLSPHPTKCESRLLQEMNAVIENRCAPTISKELKIVYVMIYLLGSNPDFSTAVEYTANDLTIPSILSATITEITKHLQNQSNLSNLSTIVLCSH